MRPFSSLLASLLLAGLGPSLAAAADVAHGKVLAQRWCAECHVVASDQTRANADVATFTSLARRADFSPRSSPSSCSIRIRRCRTCRSAVRRRAISRPMSRR